MLGYFAGLPMTLPTGDRITFRDFKGDHSRALLFWAPRQVHRPSAAEDADGALSQALNSTKRYWAQIEKRFKAADETRDPE